MTSTALIGLRLAPLLLNSFTLQYSLDEHLFLSPFVRPSSVINDTYGSSAATFLPAYFRHWIHHGIWIIIIMYPANIVLGAANLFLPGWNISATTGNARSWYAAGALLTMAHMAFGMKAMGLIAEIEGRGLSESGEGRGERRRRSTEAMGEWLGMNALRSIVTDLPAWLCYFIGVLSVFDRAVVV
jgi:hypothetical protein